MFAWSISSSSYRWVDHRSVFYTFALILGFSTILAWHTLTADIYHDRSAAEHAGEVNEDAGGVMRAADTSGSQSPDSRPAGDADLV